MVITKIVYEKGDYYIFPPSCQPADKADQRGISKSIAKERLRAKKEAATRKRRGGASFGGNVKMAQNLTISFFNVIAYF